jgi:hypothetical protein
VSRQRLGVAVVFLSIGAFSLAPGLSARHTLIRSAHFKSPSGNINCRLDDRGSRGFVDCIVLENQWPVRPAKPASCDVDFFPAEIELGATGRMTVGGCRGDIGPACLRAAPYRCTTLAYGRSITSRHFRCSSAANGITCIVRRRSNRTGFRIAREGYALFR